MIPLDFISKYNQTKDWSTLTLYRPKCCTYCNLAAQITRCSDRLLYEIQQLFR